MGAGSRPVACSGPGMHATDACPPSPKTSLRGTGPRERALEEGVGTLGDAELLAILLGTGLAGRPATVVAAALLDSAGGLEALAQLGPGAIAGHPGVGIVKAVRIVAAL